MSARLQPHEHVECRETRADHENVSLHAVVIKAPRIGDVPAMEEHFERQKVVARRKMPGCQHHAARRKAHARRRFNDEAARPAPHARDATAKAAESRAVEDLPRDLADVLSVELPWDEIVGTAARAEPPHEMIRIVAIEAHLMRARVEEMLAMARAVCGAPTKLAGFEERKRGNLRRITREVRGDRTPAKAAADDDNVHFNHRGAPCALA